MQIIPYWNMKTLTGLLLALIFSLQESKGLAAPQICSAATTVESLVRCITSHMPQHESNKFIPVSQIVTRDWQAIVRQMLKGFCE